MEWTARFEGFRCPSCGEELSPSAGVGRCPDCGGALAVAMDTTDVAWPSDPGPGDMWAFAELLPVDAGDGDLRPGGTPLVDAPAVADMVGFDRVRVKDESRNPTGSVWDRDLAVAGRAASILGASTLALPAAGAAGQAAAAVAARTDLDARVYVPSRANFTAKAAINVSGGEMTVVPGRYADARTAYVDAREDAGWHPVEPGVNPFLRAGRWTAYWETLAALDRSVPASLVVPVGTGDGLAALVEAATMAREAGVIDELPTVVAVQPAGCAPIVEAFRGGLDEPVAVDTPDTICGELEIADPPAGTLALSLLRDAGGTALTVTDEEIYRAAVSLSRTDGLVPSLAGGAAVAALEELVDELDDPATAVVVNPHAGLADADRLRSYLMGQGE